jgi:hypothetical protein
MTSYLPGELATLVTDEGVVVSTPDRLAEVAALGERDLAAPTVVEVLSRGDLRALPEFAAVRLDGAEARILVRGGLVVRTDGFAVDGRDATMWTEATATLGPGATVEIAPLGTPAAGPALPLTTGVVRSAGVTWHPVVPAAAAPASAPAPAPETSYAPADEYTVVRGSQRPAVPPPAGPDAPTTPPPSAPPAAPPPGWQPLPTGDPSPEHDGRTITPAQLQALRAAAAQPGSVPGTPPPSSPPPTMRPPAVAVRPAVALALSTGRVVPVRRRVLIGRSPRIQQVGGSQNLPALVTVDDPYVSSTHLEVSADGSRVTVTDMSTNGTLLARQGRVPVPLDRGVVTEVALGDVLTLSKGLTATVVPAPDEV